MINKNNLIWDFRIDNKESNKRVKNKFNEVTYNTGGQKKGGSGGGNNK